MDINIISARLLTKEEVEALPERLIRYNSSWWTSTAVADYPNCAWGATYNYGNLFYIAVEVENAVRLALIFESKDLEVGDMFSFGGKEFEVIKGGLAFCTTDIGECAFRTDWYAKDANQYEASDIKKFIDKWFAENLKTNNKQTERKTNMENYIVINGKKAELTKEQLEKLGIEVEKENPFERAVGDKYYFLTSYDEINYAMDDSTYDSERYCVGNYCRDQDLIQQRAYHEILDRLLWRFACENGELENPWDGKHQHWRVVCSAPEKNFWPTYTRYSKGNGPHFPSKEIANRAIDEIVIPFMKEHPDFVW